VETIQQDSDAFCHIADGKFDALHTHMPGFYTKDPLHDFLRRLGPKRPRVVETNVFGRLQDRRADGVTDFRLFISMTSACQAASRKWKTVRSLDHCNVARYPVLPAPVFSQQARSEIRKELGVAEEEVLALRLGRPDPAKWTNFECLSTKSLLSGCHGRLKLLLIEPPKDLRGRVEQGEYGRGIIVRDLERDPSTVARLIDACDVIFHAARFGESFGYAIAEGMAAGKPVITRTTPYGDNAQIELVENGVSGFVCCSEEGAVAGLKCLVENDELRASMGQSAKDRILSLADYQTECQILEAALSHNTAVLSSRWKRVIEYSDAFKERQWDVIEKTHAKRVPNALSILSRERSYSRRQELRKALGGVRAEIRALLGLPSYK